MPLCDAIWADEDSCHCTFAHSEPFISFSSLLIPFKSYESRYLRAATGAGEVALWSLEPTSVNESQRRASRSRTCLPFLHSIFVTNFNNFWHSINFSLLRDMRLHLYFSPSVLQKCHESCWGRVYRRLAGDGVYKWLPCFFPFFCFILSKTNQ